MPGDRIGRTTTYGYSNSANLLGSKTYPDLSKVSLNYDEALQLIAASVKNSSGAEQTSLVYTYTLAGRVSTVTQNPFAVSRTQAPRIMPSNSRLA